MTSLAPVPSENETCANCAAPLVAGQRYCLSCGEPVSPVRLAFLDVLESERQPQLGAGIASTVPVAFTPYIEPAAGPAWLRRYAPLLSVLSVLLLAMIVGLLVGHWVTQSKAPATAQVIKVEGLGGLASGAGATGAGAATNGDTTTPTSTTPAAGTSKSSSPSKGEEAQEEAEAKAEEKAEEKAPAKAPEAKKVSSSTLSKLEKSHGKAHEKQLNEISTAPIEVK